MSRLRLVLLPTVTALIAAIIVTSVVLVSSGTAQEGGGVVRQPAVDRAQVLSDLPHAREALEAGEPVDIVVAGPPDPTARPHSHGPFRIVPEGFTGLLPTTKVADLPAVRGVKTADPGVIRVSPLWRDAPVGPDFALVSADTFGVQTSNVSLQARYRSEMSGAEFQYYRRRIVELPIDLHFKEDGALRLEEIRLSDGRFALVISGSGYLVAEAYDPQTKILTAVEGRSGLTPQQLVEILERVEG